MVYILATNRNQFNASAQPIIDNCVYALILVAINGFLMAMGPEWCGISIAQIGEWYAFYSDFFIRFQIARIMNYRLVVEPVKQE
jgi:hypothetical protein